MAGKDNRLLRFMAIHALIGSAVAVGTVAMILAIDFAGLRSLILRSDDGPLALVIFTVFFIITFGSVQIGVAIMSMPWDDDRSSDTGEGTGSQASSFSPSPLFTIRIPPAG